MEPMKKGHHRLEVMSHYYGKRIQQDMSNFVKWILLALLIHKLYILIHIQDFPLSASSEYITQKGSAQNRF